MRDFDGVDGASGGNAIDNTRWTPAVANAIVQEISNVITDPDGGNVALNPADNTQLLTAIQTMISAATDTVERKRGRWTSTVNAGSSYLVAFEAPFPDGTDYVVTLTPLNLSSSAARDNWCQRGPSSEAGFYVIIQGTVTGGNNTLDGFDWVAEAIA
ncbi:hypothetical protein P1X14_21565 [Sphingomonas sp. AOB5]|uniref:hypothetical protein n=1 Tax=Sphingomonas sp. AOB5 TaxID=3034017 RepID=UPI0023F790E5|nr:hypothetical protein [Sphingomonas sp. AOB5]MDF7777858.1 hypothetical protein [Sphingomonas sp. AOB5]